MLLPTVAVFTINQEWSIYLDIIGISFKPWRLFLMICGLPNLICAILLYLYVPESPKFTFSQGDEAGTLKILQQMYCVNTGSDPSTYEVIGLIKDEEFDSKQEHGDKNFISIMWSESLPLFKGKYLRNILTACFIHFSVCLTSNGFWTFLPEILNKISLWTDVSQEPATVCEIFYAKDLAKNQAEEASVCMQKLELGTFLHIYEIIVLYGVCYAVMSLLINRIGKLSILLAIMVTCGVAALSLTVIRVPAMLSYTYLYMLLPALCISVVNASTAELFPTKMRFVL